MEKTLLLNATYEPLRIIPWDRAVQLVFLNKVEIVESYDRYIRSLSVAMRVPAVVRTKRFVPFQRSYRTVKFSRQNVFTRDRHTCQYCGEKFRPEHLTFDHVIPQCQGGPTTFDNIVSACKPCNYKKAGKTPLQANMPLLSRMYRPTWPLSVTLMLAMSTPPKEWSAYLFGGKGGDTDLRGENGVTV